MKLATLFILKHLVWAFACSSKVPRYYCYVSVLYCTINYTFPTCTYFIYSNLIAVPVTINKVVEVKINGILYSIRLLEECFGDNYNRLISDWKYQKTEECSSDEEDSEINSVLMGR